MRSLNNKESQMVSGAKTAVLKSQTLHDLLAQAPMVAIG